MAKTLNSQSVRGSEKYCPRCCNWKTFESFNQNHIASTGLHSYCKACESEIQRARYQKKPVKPSGQIIRNGSEKYCPSCQTWKSLESFCRNTPKPTGLNTKCKVCANQYRRTRYQKKLTRLHGQVICNNKKWCPICKIWKSLKSFYKDSASPTKLTSRCKECLIPKSRCYYQKIRRQRLLQPQKPNAQTIQSGKKRCSKCKTWKSLDAFNKHKTQPTGLSSACRKCSKPTPEHNRIVHLKHCFGLTLEDYDRMLESQNGQCAICGTKEPGGKRNKYFAVDHDHVTRKIRGLLCGNCNQALGAFKDSFEFLESAIQYLATVEYTPLNTTQSHVSKTSVCRRTRNYKRNYGLTIEDYDQMFEDQDGRCVICGAESPGSKRKHFFIDHDHETGKIRGLLCGHCNTALGQFKDDPVTIELAIEYLGVYV